jgi:hypothetical protein
MSQNISSYIVFPAITLLAGASANVDVRLSDIQTMQVLLTQTWPSSGSAGLACNLYTGFGGVDPLERTAPIPVVVSNPSTSNPSTIPVFSSNYSPVTLANPTGSLTSTKTSFFMNGVLNAWPGWVRFQVVNLDGSRSASITLLANI